MAIMNPIINITAPGSGYNGYTLTLPNTKYESKVPQMDLSNSSINFNVVKANGGWIVQVNSPDPVPGSYRVPQLYIINEDANFDTELGKIITTSCLKA